MKTHYLSPAYAKDNTIAFIENETIQALEKSPPDQLILNNAGMMAPISEKECKKIIESKSLQQSLTSLRLTGVEITDDCIPALSKFNKLTELSLTYTHLSGNAIAQLVSFLPKLHTLSISEMDFSHSLLHAIETKIKNLTARRCPINANVASRLSRLQNLDLAASSLNDETAAILATSKTLKSLKVFCCHISSKGLCALLQNKSLITLDVSFNPIQDHSWLTQFKKNDSLKTFEIDGISDEILKKIINPILARNKRLTHHWARLSILTASYRANKDSQIQHSILSLVNPIVKLIKV